MKSFTILASTLLLASLLFTTTTAQTDRIKHVVVVIMENHSFENMLGWLKKNNSNIDGLTGSEFNINPTTNQPVYVTNQGAYVDPDPIHSLAGTAWQIYGTENVPSSWEHDSTYVKMNGFIANELTNVNASWAPNVMDCIDPVHVPVISTLAMQFGLIDHFHASIPGPTYPNRLFALSGTSWGYTENNNPQILLGFPQKPIFGLLDDKNISWGVYINDASTSWLFQYGRSLASLS